jgi:cytochrome c peroxidase
VVNPELLGGAYDTPSLSGLALTAPYFHDGSAKTLDEVLAQNHDRMGTTSHLSEADRAALVAFLKTL